MLSYLQHDEAILGGIIIDIAHPWPKREDGTLDPEAGKMVFYYYDQSAPQPRLQSAISFSGVPLSQTEMGDIQRITRIERENIRGFVQSTGGSEEGEAGGGAGQITLGPQCVSEGLTEFVFRIPARVLDHNDLGDDFSFLKKRDSSTPLRMEELDEILDLEIDLFKIKRKVLLGVSCMNRIQLKKRSLDLEKHKENRV